MRIRNPGRRANTSPFLPELVDLEHAEDGDGVHEGGVKLEVGVVGADVIAT
jgi:hypothetical protein